jgi:hypothetical protein
MPAALAPESLRDQYISPLHHESGEAQPRGRALVALSDGGQAGALTLVLTRVGFTVDAGGDGEEAARLIERGVYALVAMGKKGGAPDPGLFQRTIRLRPDARRRVFVLLVGEEFRSGDPLQAFTALADLVVQPRDLSACEGVLRTTLAERHRLYQAFLEARQRAEGGLAPQ